jgi:uncharacterized integral membrane protein
MPSLQERVARYEGRGRIIAGVLVGALITAFALLNLDEVRVDWILGEGSTPLIVVIVVTFACGTFAGWAFARHRRR